MKAHPHTTLVPSISVHVRIRSLEHLLHIYYNLSFKARRVRTYDQQKEKEESKKIQKIIRFVD